MYLDLAVPLSFLLEFQHPDILKYFHVGGSENCAEMMQGSNQDLMAAK